MTVQQIMDMASAGELRQLTNLQDESIISYINLGMLELYKRFRLELEETIIQLGVPTTIDDDYIMISDTQYQMPVGFMMITDAYEEDGSHIPINEIDNLLSINTISWNKIQVPTPTDNANISIIYLKEPTIIGIADVGEQLQLPPQLIEALLHYIGYRAHGSIDASVEAENNTHYQRFDRSCSRAKIDGLITPEGLSTFSRLSKKGFA